MIRISNKDEITITCANCNNIRNDNGQWLKPEEYLRKHAWFIFSHGICEKCMTALYPDLFPGK